MIINFPRETRAFLMIKWWLKRISLLLSGICANFDFVCYIDENHLNQYFWISAYTVLIVISCVYVFASDVWWLLLGIERGHSFPPPLPGVVVGEGLPK